MKKAFPANINGKIFYIDEDAYSLLNNYLTQLHSAFTGAEADEIVADIESRVGELLTEITLSGQDVITIADINRVIETMGRPEQISDSGAAPFEEAAEAATPPPYNGRVKKKLFRDERNKVVGGVLSGLGNYLDWNVTILRILTVVLACCTMFWPCVIIYLVAWMIIPPANTPRQILEMKGEPVTLSSIGETIVNGGRTATSWMGDALQILCKFIIGFFGVLCALGALTLIIVALCVMAGMVIYASSGSFGPLALFSLSTAAAYTEGWGLTLLMLSIALPLTMLGWAGCAAMFKAPAISKGVLIAGVVFETLLIVSTVVLMSL